MRLFSSALRRAEKYLKNSKIPLDKSGSCAIIQKLSDSATEYGGIAQLGERLNGIQEVSGSIPLISTTKCPEFFGIQGFFFVFNPKKSRFYIHCCRVQHFDRNLTGISFCLLSPYSLFCLADTKGLVKSLCGFLTDRTLDMKIMFCHVGVRMANHRLDCLDVHPQCLHLADVGMAAAVGR